MRVDDYESLSFAVRLFCWTTDFVGHALRSVVHRQAAGDPRDARNLLVARLDGLGDVTVSVPTLRALRRARRNARIVLLVGPWSEGLARRIPYVDAVEVHSPWSFRVLRYGDLRPRLRDAMAFYRRMRTERFDAALDLRGDLLSLLVLWWIGVPVLAGRVTRGGGFVCTHPIRIDLRTVPHESDRALHAAAIFGADVSDREPELPVRDDDRRSACRLLAQHGLKEGHPYALLAPGALWPYRRWPSERFAEVADALCQRHGLIPVLIGDASERATTEAVKTRCCAPVIDLCGATDLSALLGLIDQTAIYVGNESGPAQLAMASRRPCVVLFGPGIPKNFGPIRSGAVAIQESCAHGPCFQKGPCKNLPDWCMGRLRVERVLEVVESLVTAERLAR